MAESNTISGEISFAGLGSGTDFQAMIDKLIEVESIHKQRLQLWRREWELKVEGFQELNTKMLSLKTTLDGMDSLNEFLAKNASSTDSTAVTATVDADAEEGSHTVLVNRLAQNAVLTDSTAYTATTDTFTGVAINWDYHYAGTDYSLAVPANTTVEGFVNLFNNDPNNPGVRMSTISDGTSIYLQMRGLDMGDDADLVASSAGWAVTQTNQDSQIRVDGWPAAAWIETDSNTVSGVVPGVTFNLKDTTASAAQITIATDTEAVKEKVRTYVSQVNEVRSKVIELTKFDDVEQQGSLLTGNYGVQLIDSQLKNANAQKGLGFQYFDSSTGTGDRYSSLSQIGILTDAEEGSATKGLLVLDEEMLDDALDNYPDLVAQLFAAEGTGATDSANFSFHTSLYDAGITKPGEYAVSYTLDGAGQITAATINGVAATIDNATHTITSQDTGDSRGLEIMVNNYGDVAGSYGGNVRMRQGKAAELSDLLSTLTSSSSGPLHILEENYDDIMQSIDAKIDYEDRRLIKMEQTLKLKYSRLDATLNRYQNLQTTLSNQIAQLSNS